MTGEDIYEGLETAAHIINIIENICERFDMMMNIINVYIHLKNTIDLKL